MIAHPLILQMASLKNIDVFLHWQIYIFPPIKTDNSSLIIQEVHVQKFLIVSNISFRAHL